MQPMPALLLQQPPPSPALTQRITRDDLCDVVKKEDEQWRTDPARRAHVCWVLKNWFPIDFCPESAYDLLSRLGGFGEDGLLQKVVNESLLHPMTGVSYKPTDCALVLNRPCLRYKNINFKLAGFVRVDGSRYLKADAVERYQEDVSFPGLLDDVLEASKDGTDWRLFGPSVQKKGCWAFMDFAKMRARPPRPPRLAPAPAQPRIAHSHPASQDALRDMAESLDIMLAHDVHGHLDMVGIEVRRTPRPAPVAARIATHRPLPSGAAQAVYCGLLEENMLKTEEVLKAETELYLDSGSDASQDSDIADIGDLDEL